MVEPMEATDDSDNMAEVTEEEEEVDRGDVLWSQLLPELLRLIYRKLPDTGDFVRFRAVCTAWRDAALVSDPPPQLPWIVQHGHRTQGVLARPRLRFYSHSSARTYHVGVEGRRSLLLAPGAFQGHAVATVDLATTILYNPFTGERRALPPAPYLKWSKHEVRGVFTVVPDDGAGCVVVNTCTRTRHFAYFRPGVDDAGWSVFDRRKNLCANAYHGGRFYANDTATMETLAINAATRAVEAVVQRPLGEKFHSARGDYLVGSTHGRKLLRAVKQPRCGTQAAADTDVYFNVYQLDVPAAAAAGGKQAAWTKVDTIGDAVLFIDDYGQGFSMEPNDAAGLRRDCVYFMHVKWTWGWQYRFLCRYSMEDGRVDKAVPLGETFGETWILPSLRYSDE
ncbi:hypothetical protein EJB05_19464, partial [Eragrostis curvula]